MTKQNTLDLKKPLKHLGTKRKRDRKAAKAAQKKIQKVESSY